MKKHSGYVSTGAFALAMAIAAFVPTAADAAAYMKLGDIKGESIDRAYAGEVEILSWSWGETRSGASTSMATGKRQHKPIMITKTIDKASPILQKANAEGSVIPSMTLHLPNQEGKRQTYLKLELENVLVSAYQTAGGGGSGAAQTESISLNYEKIKEVKKSDQDRAVKNYDRN